MLARFVADLFMCRPKPTRSITRYLNRVSADHSLVLYGIASIAGIANIADTVDIADVALVLHPLRILLPDLIWQVFGQQVLSNQTDDLFILR